MAQYVAVRALSRSPKIRVINSAGNPVALSTTTDTVLDLDLSTNRVALNHHRSIGQFIISATNASAGAAGSKSALPSNS